MDILKILVTDGVIALAPRCISFAGNPSKHTDFASSRDWITLRNPPPPSHHWEVEDLLWGTDFAIYWETRFCWLHMHRSFCQSSRFWQNLKVLHNPYQAHILDCSGVITGSTGFGGGGGAHRFFHDLSEEQHPYFAHILIGCCPDFAIT